MPKQWVKIKTQEFCDAQADPTNFSQPCKVADPEQIKKNVLAAINQQDHKSLQTLLLSYFIYPKRGEKYNDYYRGNWHTRSWTTQDALTRPTVEALFIEHPAVFKELLDAVIKTNNEQLAQTFLTCCQNERVDIAKTIFLPLNEENERKLANEIISLRALDPGNPKLQSLANALATQLLAWPQSTSQLETLQHKLNFITTLHQEDKHFAHEPNYRKIIINILSIIFTGGLLNLGNKVFTGHYLFFRHTPTQQRIANMDKVVEKEQLRPPFPKTELDEDEKKLQPGDVITPLPTPPVIPHVDYIHYNDYIHSNRLSAHPFLF